MHGTPRPASSGSRHRPGDVGAREVVVLQHHPVAEVQPVVQTPSGPHRGLLQDPQAGRGLAGVPDPCASARRRHPAGGLGGDPREAAEEVEGCAFGGQNRRQRAPHLSHHVAGVETPTIGAVPRHPDGRVHLPEGLLGTRRAGQDASGARHDGTHRQRPYRQEGGTQVAIRLQVLPECPTNGIGHRCGWWRDSTDLAGQVCCHDRHEVVRDGDGHEPEACPGGTRIRRDSVTSVANQRSRSTAAVARTAATRARSISTPVAAPPACTTRAVE